MVIKFGFLTLKNMNIRDLVEELGYPTTLNGYCVSRRSAEFFSPCPFCTDDKGHGEDRFHCWPDELNKDGIFTGGRYWCRKCKRFGDALNFLKETRGLNYLEACTCLRVAPKTRTNLLRTQSVPKLYAAEDPPELWQEKARIFVEECHRFLLENRHALALVEQRGLTVESIKRFKLGYNAGDREGRDFWFNRKMWGLPEGLNEKGNPKKIWLPVGLTIPTFEEDKLVRLKIRRVDEAIAASVKVGRSEQKYVAVSGLKKCISIYGDTNLPVALVLESELDAMVVQQQAADLVFCVALSGSTQPLDKRTHELLQNAQIVLFCPDFDAAGAVAWKEWKKKLPHIRCLLTPEEKSPGDEFVAGLDLREWLLEGMRS